MHTDSLRSRVSGQGSKTPCGWRMLVAKKGGIRNQIENGTGFCSLCSLFVVPLEQSVMCDPFIAQKAVTSLRWGLCSYRSRNTHRRLTHELVGNLNRTLLETLISERTVFVFLLRPHIDMECFHLSFLSLSQNVCNLWGMIRIIHRASLQSSVGY